MEDIFIGEQLKREINSCWKLALTNSTRVSFKLRFKEFSDKVKKMKYITLFQKEFSISRSAHSDENKTE